MTRGRSKPVIYPFIVALDGSWAEAKVWAKRLKGRVWGFKIGSILFSEMGPRAVEHFQNEGHRIFLDLKYHDIPNTVQHAVKRAFGWGVDLVTIHACGGKEMCEAAASEQTQDQKVLAVTVLTSLDGGDLKDIGVSSDVAAQVRRLGRLAVDSGVKGLVCSPREAKSLRKEFPKTVLVTPGVRLSAGGDDQKRTETIASALANGSSLVVLGRALTAEKNWEKQWDLITSSLGETSLKKRSL